MKILHYIADRSGIFMYRCYFPMTTIQANTEHNLLCSNSANFTNPDDIANIQWCDIVVFHRQHGEAALKCAKYAKMLGKKVMFEIDDDWFHLNDDNPFAVNIKKDPQIIEGLIKFLNYADGITVTNQALKNEIGKHCDPNKIHIVANYISHEYFSHNTTPQKRNPERLNLLWSGAQNHLYSIRLLIDPIKAIMDKYDHVDFVIVGSNYISEFPFMKKSRFYYVQWTDIESYPSALQLGDIALAPLSEDGGFNKCKSNIRIQEASWHGMPVVASNRYQYEKTIQHGKTGYLASNDTDWVNYLSKLIEDDAHRKEMAKNAKEWAQTMTIEVNYHKWVEIYEAILNG